MSRKVNRKQIPYLIFPSVIVIMLMVWSVIEMMNDCTGITSFRATFMASVTAYLLSTVWLLLIYKYDRGAEGDEYFCFSGYYDGENWLPHLELCCVSVFAYAVIVFAEGFRTEAKEKRRRQINDVTRRLIG